MYNVDKKLVEDYLFALVCGKLETVNTMLLSKQWHIAGPRILWQIVVLATCITALEEKYIL